MYSNLKVEKIKSKWCSVKGVWGIVCHVCGIVLRLCSAIVNQELCECLACMAMVNVSRSVDI